MNRLVASVLLAGATIVAAQTAENTPVKMQSAVQTKECTELAAQLQQKLNLALGKAEVDVEKARQAALAFQNQMQGKTEAELDTIIKQKRVMAQAQLQTAIANLEQVSAQVQAQVKEASEQIQTRLQEKATELKMIQARIQARKGSGDSGDGNGEKKGGK